MLCLTGRHLKEPFLPPTLSAKAMFALTGKGSTLTLVRFGYREAWISSVCGGRVSGGRLTDTALKVVRDALVKAMVAAVKQKRTAETSKAASCRSVLGLDDDDDIDNAGAATEGVEADSQDISGLHSISFNGQAFQMAKVRRQLHIEGTVKVMETVCSACLDAASDIVKKDTATQAAISSVGASSECDDAVVEDDDAGARLSQKVINQRVQWMAKSQTWQVTYAAADGKCHRSVRGLKVPKQNDAGGPLHGSPYRKVFAATMERAKQQWNVLDKSDGERFLLGEEI